MRRAEIGRERQADEQDRRSSSRCDARRGGRSGTAGVSGSGAARAPRKHDRSDQRRRRGSSPPGRAEPGTRSATAVAAAAIAEPRRPARQRSGHRDHRCRDDRRRGELEAVHPARALEIDTPRPERERRQDHGGRKREAEPGGEPAELAGPVDADRDPELAGRRPGQQVRERDELAELLARRASGGARRTRRGSSRCGRPGRRTRSARGGARRGTPRRRDPVTATLPASRAARPHRRARWRRARG